VRRLRFGGQPNHLILAAPKKKKRKSGKTMRNKYKNKSKQLGSVTHNCNPGYVEGSDRKNWGLRLACTKR
jgi:hypothetical protein